ncbi:Protein phosphatase, putative [Hondaea fermentalgiana]|uniref:Protein phosphatase, putative n=1 Tax=Hondaea fermentalgiana TaxID=2315210 RepID=A0A2R5H0L0_9STRA|nr:Protein phosphatase, putative [Hondaea fermentalgiana]|eukprot:GBG33854.1 Protein phosphatase, putative [Hondaea fermentalgiana]
MSDGMPPKPPALTRQLTSHFDQFADDLAALDGVAPGQSLKSDENNDNGGGLRLLVSAATDIGGGAVNQDKFDFFMVEQNLVMAVFDGHGRELGELAAEVARDTFHEYLSKTETMEKVSEDPETTLTEIFQAAHDAIRNRFREKYVHAGWQVQETDEGFLIKRRTSANSWSCTHGGTTATVVIVFGGSNRMIVANVGDSTALWGSIDADGTALYEELSAEHSPESVSEFKRIREFRPDESGRMPQLRFVYDASSMSKATCPPIFDVDPDDPDNIKRTNSGSYFKNVRSEFATLVTTPPSPQARFQDALAFTRSLADYHLNSFGVSCVPEVRDLNLADLHKSGTGPSCLLVCTDGVWDNFKYPDVVVEALREEVVGQVVRSGDCKPAAQALMSVNMRLAHAHFGNQADNMTAIVCYVV